MAPPVWRWLPRRIAIQMDAKASEGKAAEGKEEGDAADDSEVIMDCLMFLEELQDTDYNADGMSELQAFEERCLKQFDDCSEEEFSLEQKRLRA